MIELEDPEPLSSSKREAIEAETKVRLPDDFRLFLESTNGGRPKLDMSVIDPRTDSALTDLKTFLGDRKSWEQNLLNVFGALRSRIPLGAIPIAIDSGGNAFLLDCRPNGTGAIYFFGLETSARSGSNLETMLKVADSFTDLIRKLDVAT